MTSRILSLLVLPLTGMAFLGANANAADVGVLIRFGLKDHKSTQWDGSIAVSEGKVASLEGWRFEDKDAVNGVEGWKASTRALAQRNARGNNPQKLGMKKQQLEAQANQVIADNGFIAQLTGASAGTQVTLKTTQGEITFKLGDLKLGEPVPELDGSVAVERVSATQGVTAAADQNDNDFPSIAIDKDGGTWVAYTSFTPGMDRGVRAKPFDAEPQSFDELAKPPGGDQVWLTHKKAGSETWDAPVSIVDKGADVMRCAVAIGADNQPLVIWSEGHEGRFAVRSYLHAPGTDQKPSYHDVSSSGKNAVSPVAATTANGTIWIAWQEEHDGHFQIYARLQAADAKPFLVSEGLTRNCWSPAITASAKGKIAIAWDSYEKGDYDVYVREYDAAGKAGAVTAVANSPKYESRPSITYDTKGRLWIAWEQSGPKWGKDWGAYDKDDGIGLYKNRTIGLRVLDGGVWKDPAESPLAALPGRVGQKGTVVPKWTERNDAKTVNNGGFAGDEKKPGKRNQGGALVRQKAEEAQAQGLQIFNNLARICADKAGRVWLLCRTKQGQFHTPLGSVWLDYASCYDGEKWLGPVLIPHTDNLLFNQPAIIGTAQGIRLAHSTDHRQDRLTVWKQSKLDTQKNKSGGNASLASSKDPFINGIYVSDLTLDTEAKPLVLNDAKEKPLDHPQPAPYTVSEIGDVKAIRAYRSTVNGSELRILRGEFHRHTEISGDGGGDGPLEDMWRYALDVATMDWLGCGDHDNGGGREYPWWLTQKTTDAYRIPGLFDPLFTYERSVSYPEGHRNVIFVQRGVRTLPRLPISDAFDSKPAPDTQMLYKYLHHFNGICASHTSATNMGTDWRDNDHEVEPFVEIYQGARQNYERPGAPRCPTADDAIGGWEPKGMVNLALLKGYRLAFESSSDHGSTHISYACVYAKEATRQGIFDAMKLRHTYAATDNIIAEMRTTAGGKEYMMGDEFTTSETPTLNVKLIGTKPIVKVTVIKDDVEMQVTEPKTKEVNFTFKDPSPQSGKTSYYYVRGEQEDTELVWVSPMWIKYAPGGATAAK